MATADRILMLKLLGDTGSIDKSLKKTSGRLSKFGSAAGKWAKAFTGALVLQGLDTLVGSLGDAMEGFKAGEDAARAVGQTWKNLGRDSDELAGILDNLGAKALDLGFDDAEVMTAFNTYLTKTGSVSKSLRLVQQAMDLARAKGITFARAAKLVAGNLDLSDEALRRNRRQARVWARNHPLEVGLGKIGDLWEEFVGNFSQGKINKAFAALGGIGETINDLIFGEVVNNTGIRTGGLAARFAGIGGKLVDALVKGLVTLGASIQTVWDEQIATVDWAKAIPDALGTFWTDTLQPFLAGVAEKGPIAATAITAIAVALGVMMIPVVLMAGKLTLLALAIGAIIVTLPAIQQFLQGVIDRISQIFESVLANLRTLAAQIATHIGNLQTILQTVQTALQPILNTISGVFDATVGHINNLIGTISNTINYAIEQWNRLMALLGGGARGTPFDFGPNPFPGEQFAKGGVSKGGWALTGERGPELVNLSRGSRVYSAGETAGMMGGSVTVNVYVSPTADLASVGREINRALVAYKRRGGRIGEH